MDLLERFRALWRRPGRATELMSDWLGHSLSRDRGPPLKTDEMYMPGWDDPRKMTNAALESYSVKRGALLGSVLKNTWPDDDGSDDYVSYDEWLKGPVTEYKPLFNVGRNVGSDDDSPSDRTEHTTCEDNKAEAVSARGHRGPPNCS